MEYEFYRDVYGGTLLPEAEFAECAARALDVLTSFYCLYTVAPRPTAEDGPEKAACAMAEEIYRYRKALAESRSVSVGSVKCGAAAKPDATAHRRALLRCAEEYLDIYRGVEAAG